MNIEELATKKAEELVSQLQQQGKGKQALDMASLLAQAGDAVRNVQLSGDNRQLLRNAAIGVGTGAVAGLSGSSRGHRLGDTLQGALAGGLVGGGGTLAYRAATGGNVPGAPRPNAAAAGGSAASAGASEDGGGMLQALWDRKFTAAAATGVAADRGIKMTDELYGTGSYGNRRFSSPLQSAYMPHRPGEPAATGMLGTIKGLLGSEQTHDDRVGSKIKANLSSWLNQTDQPLGEDHIKVLKALNTLDSSTLGRTTSQLANMTDAATPATKTQLNAQTKAYNKLLETLHLGGKDAPSASKVFPDAKTLDSYLSRSAPASLTGISRWKTPAALALSAIAEPTVVGGLKSLVSGNVNNRRLTPEQIADINARYFGE